MVCPACPTIGWFGGLIGGYFGVNVPERVGVRICSIAATGAAVTITVVALKCMLGIALCDGKGNFSLVNIARVGSISLVMGVICSIAVNYLLNRYLSSPNEPPPACCCSLGATKTS